MPLCVYYKDDIERILTALASAGVMHWPNYHKALYDVALAFGVDLTKPSWQSTVTGGACENHDNSI